MEGTQLHVYERDGLSVVGGLGTVKVGVGALRTVAHVCERGRSLASRAQVSGRTWPALRGSLCCTLYLLSSFCSLAQHLHIWDQQQLAMMPKFVSVLVLLLVLVAISMVQEMAMAAHGHGGHHFNNGNRFGPGSLKIYQCPSQCTRRCSKTQYHKPCMFFCQKCCQKCLCVPPGYYGNKGFCPCYNNWKTKEGGPKCP
ncbi:hypothetical protein SAY86_018690 [Trapa natans]|uniref:Uncharacterized protein n=1 Tax=Trapa natans TaxID=22666 RepID=A0AAN7QZ24_TRANT|nr:hypothetical protein SAY86_018690 [Trapa natans]